MRYAELFDGTVLSFPDGTPDEVVARVAKEQTLLRQPAPPAPSTERTGGEAIKDVGASLVTGTGRMLAFPGQAIALIPGMRGVGEAIARPGTALADIGEDLKSQGLKAREALRSEAISEAEKDGILSEFATAIKSTITDPALLISFVTEQLPNFLPPAGVARVVGKLGISAAKGLTGEAAKDAVALANKRAVGAAVGTGAAMQAADISSEAYKRAYEAAIAQGKDPEQAEAEANNAARIAAGGAFGVSLVSQRLPGAKAIEERLAKVPGTAGRVGGAFGEATAETLEESGGQVFQNIGVRTVDPTQSLTEGVGAAAGLGLLGGGFFGALLSKKAVPETLPGQLPGETIEQSIQRLVSERESLKAPPVPETIISDEDVIKLAGSTNEEGQPVGYGLLTQYEERLKQLPESEERNRALDVASSVKERLNIETIQRQQSAYQNIITYKDMKDLGFNESDPIYEALVGKNLGKPDDAVAVLDRLKQELSQDIPSERRELVGTMLEQAQGFVDQIPGSVFYAPRAGEPGGRADEGGVGTGISIPDQRGEASTEVVEPSEPGDVDSGEGVSGQPAGRKKAQPTALRFETEDGSVDVSAYLDAGPSLYATPEDVAQIEASLEDKRNTYQVGYRQSFESGDMFYPVQSQSEIPIDAEPFIAVVNRANGNIVTAFPAQANPAVGLQPVQKRFQAGRSSVNIGKPIRRVLTEKDIVTPKMLEELGIKKQSAVAKRILGKEVKSPEVKKELAARKSLRPEVTEPVEPQEAPPVEQTPKEQIDAINRRLEVLMQNLLKQYGLKDVSVKIVKDLKAKGEYSGRLIKLADDTDNPLLDLKHEAIHALKELGFFTPGQWETLKNKASKEWIDTYLKDVPYTDTVSRYQAYKQMFEEEGKNPAEVEEALIEEAIADAFSFYAATRPPTGMMSAITNRMKNLFKAFKQFLVTSELSAEDIFGKIQEGKLPSKAQVKPIEGTRYSLKVMQGEPPKLEGKVTVDRVGKYFDDEVLKEFKRQLDYSNPEDFARAVMSASGEVTYQLQQENSGLDWYEEDVQRAFEETQKVIPSLSDPSERVLFSVIAGIMSPQTTARDNWNIAAKAFQHYKSTGDIPGVNPETGGLWQGGTQSPNKKIQLDFLDRMIKDLGVNESLEWLTSDHTVKEINQFRQKYGNIKSGIDGKASDMRPGLYAFGPKVGPFVANLNGIHDVTVDKWMTRTFNRYFGTMLDSGGKIVDAPTEPQRRAIKQLVNQVAQNAGIKPYQVQSILWFYEQRLFTKLGAQSPSYGFSDGARKFAEGAGVRGGEAGKPTAEKADVSIKGRAKAPKQPTPKAVERVSQIRSKVKYSLKNINVESDNFKKWSNNAPIIPAQDTRSYKGGPAVFQAFHGSTYGDITVFDTERGNREGFLGAGPYLSTSVDDVNANYAGVGPDLTARISRAEEDFADSFYDSYAASEMLQDYFDDNDMDIEVTDENFDQLSEDYRDKAISHAAIKSLKGQSEGVVVPAYVRLLKPFDMRGDQGTNFTYEQEYDEDGEPVGNPTGTSIDLIDAIRNVASMYNTDADRLISEIYDNPDGISAKEVFDLAQKEFSSIYDDNGDLISAGQVVQDIAKEMGFDGIIQPANDYFGSARPAVFGIRPKGMQGVYPDTLHLMPFSSDQIKSSVGNIGTFGQRAPTEEEARRLGMTEAEAAKAQKKGDIRLSLRVPKQNLRTQVPANIFARVDATIGARVERTFAQRMMDSITPKAFSWFRSQAINRYEALAKLDRAYIRRMGGVRLMADQSAEAAALMSDLGAGIAASAFGVHDRTGGIPVFRNGVVKVSNENNTIKGPLAIFAPLAQYGDPNIYRLYEFWATAKRGQRLNAEGRLTPFTAADLSAAQALERRYPEFVTIQREWIKYNDGLVKFMQDTGVITPEAATEFKRHGDYFPMYKYFEEDEITGPRVFSSIANVAVPKKLKGGDETLGDFFENIVRNSQSAINAGIKNIAAQRATRIGVAVGQIIPLPAKPAKMTPDIYRVLENGKEKYYQADDIMIINALKSLNMPDLPLIGFFAGPANLLRNLVTKTPDFIGANLLRDSLSAWVTSGQNITPVISSLINFGKAIAEKSPELNALRNAGVLGGYDYAQGVQTTAQTFAKDLRKIGSGRTAMEKLASPATSVWGALEKASSASDAATRMEVYKKVLAETGNEAEALFQALEIMNFNRKGRSPVIRILTAAVPFLNARIQGLDVLYRAGIRPLFAGDATAQEKARAKTFMVRGLTLMALSAMYWAMTHDDDEYKRQEQEVRDNYWLLPSVGVKIPIPFEVGVIFKVIPERIMEYSFGDDTGQDFVNAMGRHLLNTFSFNPIPQTIIPLVETTTNRSFFTGRPILGQGLEDVSPEFQATPTTSKTAVSITDAYNEVIDLLPDAVAKKLKASPVILEHLIQGYTGTMGMYAMQTMDYIISANSDVPSPSKRFEQLPIIKRFTVDPQARGTVTAFYDLKNAVDSVTRTANYLERTQNYEDQATFIQDNINLLAQKDYVQSLEKTMKQFREQKMIIRSSTLDADSKRAYLDIIEKMEIQLTENIRFLRKLSQ